MSKSLKRMLTIAIPIMMVPLIACCIIFAPFFYTDRISDRYPNATSAFKDHGDYKINSAAIIASLDHGDTNVFMPEVSTPDSPTNGVLWHQSDILKVMNALNKHVWHDTLANWKVYEVLFHTSCKNNIKGFEGGRITFFKTVWVGPNLEYAGRSVNLTPQFDFVSWGGGTYFPHPIIGWENYDLRKFKVTADEALQIADENGGKEFRSNYADRCDILVDVIEKVHWKVKYDTGNSYFIIDIDPYSGAFKVVSAVK